MKQEHGVPYRDASGQSSFTCNAMQAVALNKPQPNVVETLERLCGECRRNVLRLPRSLCNLRLHI
jgi:hypothetical protein